MKLQFKLKSRIFSYLTSCADIIYHTMSSLSNADESRETKFVRKPAEDELSVYVLMGPMFALGGFMMKSRWPCFISLVMSLVYFSRGQTANFNFQSFFTTIMFAIMGLFMIGQQEASASASLASTASTAS